MQFSTPMLALLLSTLTSANPLSARDETPQTAHFTFHSTSSSTYDLDVLTDGSPQLTKKDCKVVSVDINDYNANTQCVFKDTSDKEIEGELRIDNETGDQSLSFGEEGKVVKSVSCEGMCLGIYADCYDPSAGMNLGPCCNGFCAANKCRPWSTGSQ